MNNEKLLRELENKKRQSRIMQKKVIVCVVAVMLLCAVAYGVMAVAEGGWMVSVEYKEANGGFIMNPVVDYEYDIMTDAGYIRLLAEEPLISFCDAATGITTTLEPEDYEDQSAATQTLIDLIFCIQAGDYEAYHGHFTDAYRASELAKDQYAERPFTMQQIYRAVITRVSEEENEMTGTLTCTYRLKYMIHENNGTFRTDLDSDSYREQELVMVNSASDPTLKINSVSTEKTLVETTVYHGWRIAAVSVVSLVAAALTVFGAIALIKKIGNGNANESDGTEEEENEQKEESEA